MKEKWMWNIKVLWHFGKQNLNFIPDEPWYANNTPRLGRHPFMCTGDASTFSLFVSRGCCLSSSPFRAARSCTNATTYIYIYITVYLCHADGSASMPMKTCWNRFFCHSHSQLWEIVDVCLWLKSIYSLSGFGIGTYLSQGSWNVRDSQLNLFGKIVLLYKKKAD